MSYKSNPWLNFDAPESEHDSDICKKDLFKFSGKIESAPDLLKHPEDGAHKKKFCRQYRGDKI